MDQIQYSKNITAKYENFEADCPYCGYHNIFNRNSDFDDFSFIDFREVVCLNEKCKQKFNINGDLINPAFELKLFEINNLLKDKNYSTCILNLCQSVEIFIKTFFNVELIYKLVNIDDEVDDINQLTIYLDKSIKNYTFYKLRNLFLLWFIKGIRPKDFSNSYDIISSLSKDLKKLKNNEIKESDLNVVADDELRSLLASLMKSEINKIRNQIIHKDAYRPSSEETENAYKEIWNMIIPLRRKLGILSCDINYYKMLKRQT